MWFISGSMFDSSLVISHLSLVIGLWLVVPIPMTNDQ